MGKDTTAKKMNAEGLCITAQSQAGKLGSLEDATVEYSWGVAPLCRTPAPSAAGIPRSFHVCLHEWVLGKAAL